MEPTTGFEPVMIRPLKVHEIVAWSIPIVFCLPKDHDLASIVLSNRTTAHSNHTASFSELATATP